MGLVVGIASPASAEGALHSMAPAGVRADKAHLENAARWLKAERPDYAVEHLWRVAIDRLWTGADEAMARLVLIGISRLEGDSPDWDALVSACAEPPLDRFAECWEARSTWHLRRGEVREGLVVLGEIARHWPEKRTVVFGRAFLQLRRLDRSVLSRDPSVQDGTLSAHLQAWAETVSAEKSPSLLLAIARLTLELSPESDAATFFADRTVTRLEADPRALALRGTLARFRGRPDRALPWFLWAAYTANSIRRPDASRHWATLAWAYAQVGWRDLALDAHGRSGSDRPFDPTIDLSRVDAENGAGCREWHDWLIAYHPETLIRRHGDAWSDGLEDLQVWHERCSVYKPMSRCLSTRGGWRGMPRWTADQLRNRTREVGFSDRLLCAVDAGIVIPESARRLAKTTSWRTGEKAGIRFVRGVIHARSGALSAALMEWDASLASETEARARESRLKAVLDELTALPRPTLRRASEALDRRLTRWTGDVRSASQRDALWTALARVRLRLDPRDPATVAAADTAVLTTDGAAKALAWRGRVALARDRPDDALPWLRWAERTSDVRYAADLPDLLARAYAGVGWWDLAERAITVQPSAASIASLVDAAPAPTLPAGCRGLLDSVGMQKISHLMARHGDRWVTHVPHLDAWQTDCSLSRGSLAPVTTPIAPSRENR